MGGYASLQQMATASISTELAVLALATAVLQTETLCAGALGLAAVAGEESNDDDRPSKESPHEVVAAEANGSIPGATDEQGASEQGASEQGGE